MCHVILFRFDEQFVKHGIAEDTLELVLHQTAAYSKVCITDGALEGNKSRDLEMMDSFERACIVILLD